MPDDASFEALKELYFSLDLNFDQLYAKCTTVEERTKFRNDYVQARGNFLKARNRIFKEDDPQVQNLVAEVSSARQQIQQSIDENQAIAQTLQIIAQGVKAGTALLAFAGFSPPIA